MRLVFIRPRGRVEHVVVSDLELSPRYYVSVDPGVEGPALAVFSAWGKLLTAGLIRPVDGNEDPIWRAARGISISAQDGWPPGVRVLVERPKIYPRSRSKADPNDLIVTALVAGAAALAITTKARVGDACFVEPWEWKGDVDGDVMVNRIKERWTTSADREVAVLPTESLAHNVWDAIGLGIWWMRELGLRARR